jgi:AcrR family transcriptional regulator
VSTTGASRTRALLGRSDWIEAGQQLLIDGGISSVKLSALTRKLSVTSGSFYHHFSGLRDYLDALADYYGGENVERVVDALASVEGAADRLRLIMVLREEWDIARLDSAMRVWATTDPRARAAVARLDDQFVEIVRSAFSELGFSDRQARLRAMFAFSAGVGQPFLFGRPSNAEDTAAALEILMAPGVDLR